VPFRVLMVVGYSNGPEDFDAQYSEFKRFLGKIHLLTDEQVMDLVAPDLEACAGNPHQSSTLEMLVRTSGSLKIKKQETSNLDQMCASEAFSAVHFPLHDEERTVKRTYDWSKPKKLTWLSDSTYEEPEVADAPSEVTRSEEAPSTADEADGKKPADLESDE
jgi:hypothetical protein